jgi:hypothetical protein
MKDRRTAWIGVLVIAAGVLAHADPAFARGAGSGGSGGTGRGGTGGGGAGAGAGAAAAAGAGGGAAAAGATGEGGPGDAAANTKPVGNWMGTFARQDQVPPGTTVVVTPEGRQIVVGPDDGYPAAFPAASPAYTGPAPERAAPTLLVTPDRRQIIVIERDPSWSAARERLASRTFYPGICPDIDHRTDTLCYESP